MRPILAHATDFWRLVVRLFRIVPALSLGQDPAFLPLAASWSSSGTRQTRGSHRPSASCLPGQFGVGEAAASDRAERQLEASEVVARAVVVSECALVDVAAQVLRGDRNVSALD